MANKNKAPNTLASIQGSNEIDAVTSSSSFSIAWCNSNLAALQGCPTSISTNEVPTYEFYH